MPNRTIKGEAIWVHSDKLATCLSADPIAWELTVGTLSRLLYSYLFIPLQDDWGCFELNPPVWRIQCFGRFPVLPPEALLIACALELNHHGLLFTWEEQGKAWAYLTGKEAGRLPEPTRRHSRKTPTLGHKPKVPCQDWPQVVHYLNTYKQLQPATGGILTGYRVVQAASASPQPPTRGLQQTTGDYKAPTIDYKSPTIARAGADPDPDPESDHEQDQDQHLQLSQDAQGKPKKAAQPTTTTTRLRNATTKLQPPTGQLQSPTDKPQQGTSKLERLGKDNRNLREHLTTGIYRNDLFDYFDNSYRRCDAEKKRGLALLARELTNKCAQLLLVNRGQKELPKATVESLSEAAWGEVAASLPVFEHLKNYDARKRQLVGHVINCVVAAALHS